MALKIRLRRMGRKKAPTYRIVVAESTSPRDGRFVANLGHYNPRTEPTTLVVDRERALHWIGQGARPTETVDALLKKAGIFKPVEEAPEGVLAAVRSTSSRATQAAASVAAAVAAAVKEAAVEVQEKVEDVVEDVREAVTGRGENEVPAGAEPATEAPATLESAPGGEEAAPATEAPAIPEVTPGGEEATVEEGQKPE
jgi:small subunit ribosomal protein S16